MEEAIYAINASLEVIKTDQGQILNRLGSVESEIGKLKSAETSGNVSSDDARHRLHMNNSGVQTTSTPLISSPPNTLGTSGNSPQVNTVTSSGNVTTVQDEYQSIKDKVSGVKIPPELRVGTSKAGIRRDDQNTANVIASSARYVESTIKFLWELDGSPSQQDLVDLFTIQKAHIDYLRQEHSALVVAGQFGAKTSTKSLNIQYIE